MGSSEWPLFFMCICFRVIETEASSWTASVPKSVKGLSGSCVVIPCQFDYPAPPKTVTEFTGIWMDDDNRFIFHPDEDKVHDYHGRTSLLGDVRKKNCSLKIYPLWKNDSFFFRIEIKDHNKYSYKDAKVSISTMSEPNPIRFALTEDLNENQSVPASCSVTHSCPFSPPNFTWSHPGEKDLQSQYLSDGQWNITSILTFRPTHRDHNKSLRCNVTYEGGRQQTESKILNVKYAPTDVKVEYKQDVKEGETVELSCSGDAHPPVNRYIWLNETGGQVHSGNHYRLQNVSRHIGTLYCTAINEQGRVQSSPVQLNVLYAPEIKTASSCSSEGNLVTCECIVDSKPPSIVFFVLADKVLLGTKRDKTSYFTISAPQADFEYSTFVNCVANNTEGYTNLRLSLPFDEKMLLIFIAIGAGVILVIVSIAVGVCKKWSRSGDTPAPNMSTMMAQRDLEFPRKETYDDTPCDAIYSNDNMYGNIGGDWDEAIYGNV
ncbi:B-cell receptor CD22 isoform 1-T2 [Odontesthes bonariensis]|uniref:B-cell receptor CD22 n=1 Tax=Odontesthes bonariensis TaxID=219752 RepID=UPI003F582C3E